MQATRLSAEWQDLPVDPLKVGTLGQQLASLVVYYSDPLRKLDREAAWCRARAAAFSTRRGPAA